MTNLSFKNRVNEVESVTDSDFENNDVRESSLNSGLSGTDFLAAYMITDNNTYDKGNAVESTGKKLLSGQSLQWHLDNPGGVDINVEAVWPDYTGEGVTIGIVDDGVQYTHPELAGNYNSAIDEDILRNSADGSHKYAREGHGTAVAGVIAAANDGVGTVGVAYNADITSFRLLGANRESIDGMTNDIMQAIRAGAKVDISNNSWGFAYPFGGNSMGSLIDSALEYGITNGRDGLGTIYVYSAGNGGDKGDNANYSEMLNSRFTIAVGAVDSNGLLSYFSTPGTPVLVVAPGRNIYTTDPTGPLGFVSGDYVTLSGTSFSAPIVSGITALMLQANPDLGYRDVQEIFAYSSIQTDPTNSTWEFNGATNWNGGALHASEKYGFGLVDATAAVRLAETWDTTSPSVLANEVSYTYTSASMNVAIKDFSTTVKSIAVGTPMDIEQVELKLYMSHSKVGDLVIKLTSPDGTESILMDRPELGKSKAYYNASWTLSTTHDWGEEGVGAWTLSIQDMAAGRTGTLRGWALTLHGDAVSPDDTYIYTNEFGRFTAPADADRRVLGDSSGTDTLNASAVSSSSTVDLNPGSTSAIAGNSLTILAGTVIENLYTGDGNDTLIGNNADNLLFGGRGNDLYRILAGSFGSDIIEDLSGSADLLDLSDFSISDVLSWQGFDSDSNVNFDRLLMDFGSSNVITITDYFNNSDDSTPGSGYIENIVFLDDSSVDFAQVQSLIA